MTAEPTSPWREVPQWQTHFVRHARHYEQLASTNTEALAVGTDIDSRQLPALFVADCQTAGRGRLGRRWHADEGTLTFSILDCADRWNLDLQQLSRVALTVGLSVAEAIEMFVPPLKSWLKWPNDVYIDGGKVSGILVETVPANPSRFVLGIGVNVATDLERIDPQFRSNVRSLSATVGSPLERYQLLPLILQQLEENLALAVDDFDQLVKTMRRRCLLAGKEVTLQQGERPLRGVCEGMDHNGALRVNVAGTVVVCQSGEIVRIMRP